MLANLNEPTFAAFNNVDLGMAAIGAPGLVLRRAREAIGASLADVSRHTRIAERHLESIELGYYSEIAASIYAVGFARTYARYVGLPEDAIADAVRADYLKTPKQPFRP
ncbi:MAG: helix-turn-helix domain-containing protein [Sphingomonas sp.]|nr:helix-turn-helix domain-containing protein [Sphingomonas sp.]